MHYINPYSRSQAEITQTKRDSKWQSDLVVNHSQDSKTLIHRKKNHENRIIKEEKSVWAAVANDPAHAAVDAEKFMNEYLSAV